MFWIFLLLLFVGFVFFKLGVYAVLLGVLEVLLKIVLLVTGWWRGAIRQAGQSDSTPSGCRAMTALDASWVVKRSDALGVGGAIRYPGPLRG